MNFDEFFDTASAFYRDLQQEITTELERVEREAAVHVPGAAVDAGVSETTEPAVFQEDIWHGDGSSKLQLGGGGRTRVIADGRVFEKGGVNWSDVHGTFTEEFAAQMPGESREFRASGLSLVLHPRNPHAPTVHANFRIIRRGPAENPERLWFGGGADLTPHYLYPEDARHFHRAYKNACDRHRKVVDYDRLKAQCDEYFHLPHRGEARGVGGIFYDYLDDQHDEVFAFSREAGRNFLESFVPVVERRCGLAYGERERNFQLWKRGRYVEFNLIYDRGTIFGLRTGGRIESILMSLPPLVAWHYDFRPEPGSREEEVLNVLRNPVDWI